MPDAAPPLSVNFALNLALRVNAKTAIFTHTKNRQNIIRHAVVVS